MDLKAGNKGDNKKRGPVTNLLSRQNSKTGRGSTPVSNSDQDSPPILPDTTDSPLLNKKTANGAGSVSRTPSIKSKPTTGDPEINRNKSPSPKSPDQTPTRERSGSGQGDALLSAGDSASKVTGKRIVDSARKKILWLASKSEWGSLEQAMKTLENAIATQKGSPDSTPLAGIQDEVIHSFIKQ